MRKQSDEGQQLGQSIVYMSIGCNCLGSPILRDGFAASRYGRGRAAEGFAAAPLHAPHRPDASESSAEGLLSQDFS